MVRRHGNRREAIPSVKYLIIGDSIVDRYVYGFISRQSPEDPSIPVVDFVEEEYMLGGCLNVAANIKSLSHKFKDDVYVSSVMSDFTANLLKNKGIFYDLLVLNSKARPHDREMVKTRIVHSETHKQLLRIDNRLRFSSGDVARYKNKCSFYEGIDFDAIIVSDYNKGLIDDFILQKLKQFKGPIFIDTKKQDLSLWNDLENCFIKLNNHEYEKSSKITRHPLIVTKGPNGAELHWQKPPTRGWITTSFPTEAVEKADVIGAGDSFLAGLVVSYMETQDLHKSVEFANKVASISVKKFGTCEVRRDEVL